MCTRQVRTHFARPNWKEVFTRIASKHPNSTVGKQSAQPTLKYFLKIHKNASDATQIPQECLWCYIMPAGVFYCGAPTLAKELKTLSHEMNHKTGTRFHFHKEYFWIWDTENGHSMLVLMWSDLISIALGTGKEDGENFAQMQDNQADLLLIWNCT